MVDFLGVEDYVVGMSVVRDEGHSRGSPTVEGTGIRVVDIAEAYEHSGYDSDENTELYPDLSLSDVHTALAYYYDHIDELRTDISDSGVSA
jgi:uncharacterized protein (DUF433 family)